MEKLRFYDLAKRKNFDTDEYEIVTKGKRRFAVAESPFSENKCWKATKRVV